MDTNRRDFLKTVATAGPAVLASQAGGRCESGAGRPNVLVIHTDEHRADCLGTYGNKVVRTPSIDGLAADGVTYTNSFCPYPVCTPSRYSLLSGLYVHEHRGWSNVSTLRPEIETFPSLLRGAGYRTKAVGKMHFTPTYLDIGFDELELAEQDGPGRFDDDYHRHLKKLNLIDGIDIQDQRPEYRKLAPPEYWESFGTCRSDLPEEHHSTTWIADRAMDVLGSWTPSGNLLMVGFIKPHHPFDPPAPWDSMYDPAGTPLLPGWIDEPLTRDLELNAGYFPHSRLNPTALRRVTAFYYATISQIDHHVGRMIRLLKSKGLYDDTLVVFTADHGDYIGFHHLLLKANHMYEPVIRVPLIIKYPERAARGRRVDALVNNVDVAPTILLQAGCRRGQLMKGMDLSGTVRRETVFAESGGQRMARSLRHKLILRDPVEKSLFFDLERDPMEMTNLYGKPELQAEIDRLAQAVLGWRDPDIPTRPYVDDKAAVIRKPNVPPRDNSHRQEMIDYFRSKMQGRG